MSIKSLPDKWRKGKMYVEPDDSISRYPAFAKECADDLEAALPVWTKIEWIGDYVDPETLPPEDMTVLWGNVDDGYNNLSELWQLPPKRITDYTHWRPLCDLDTPEQKP